MVVVVLITCPCLIECVVLAVSTDPPGRPLVRMPQVDVHADLAGGEVIVRDRELVRRRVCLFGRCGSPATAISGYRPAMRNSSRTRPPGPTFISAGGHYRAAAAAERPRGRRRCR